MQTHLTLEQRVAALEEEVAVLKRRLEDPLPKEGKSWLDDVIGSMKDYSEFREVLRFGAEWRRAQREP